MRDKGTRTGWWIDDDGRYDEVHTHLSHQDEDPTFDEVAARLDGDPDVRAEAAERADLLILALADTSQEVKLLDALAVGHHLASACRLARMTRAAAEGFLLRCRERIVQDAT